MSAGTGINPFTRSCGFTQPIQNTRAAKAFEGNVDRVTEYHAVDNYVKKTNLVDYNIYQSRPEIEVNYLFKFIHLFNQFIIIGIGV